MKSIDNGPTPSGLSGLCDRRTGCGGRAGLPTGLFVAVWLLGAGLAQAVGAQTITVVGTAHLTGLEPSPDSRQFQHTIERLSAFEPTQVCVERMSGERIQAQLHDPAQHGFTFKPESHGRPLAPVIVPIGMELQFTLERRPTDARNEASELLENWNQLDTEDRIRAIGLQLAGFEFHSAVLNWSYLSDAAQRGADHVLGSNAVEALNDVLDSVHEVYALGVPLARRAGLHELCAADALEYETAGIRTALQYGGQAVIESPQVKSRIDELVGKTKTVWRPESGARALTELLRFYNGDEYAEMDRRLQWETLREFDNEAGAFRRRLMYWHARTAEISAELFRALAQGPEERVLFIIGSAHRPFTEADLRAQPWVEVQPAISLLEAK